MMDNEIQGKAFSLTISRRVKLVIKPLFPSNNLVLRVHLGSATVILMARNSHITMKKLQQVEVLSAAQARTASLETVFWEAQADLALYEEGLAEVCLARIAERVPITDF